MKTRGTMRVMGGPADGTVIRLSGAITTIGRGPGADINVGDPMVSRLHARIQADADGFWIQDLASVNGTFVNGEKLGPGPKRLLNYYRVELGGLGSPVHWVFEEVPDTRELRRMAQE